MSKTHDYGRRKGQRNIIFDGWNWQESANNRTSAIIMTFCRQQLLKAQ